MSDVMDFGQLTAFSRLRSAVHDLYVHARGYARLRPARLEEAMGIVEEHLRRLLNERQKYDTELPNPHPASGISDAFASNPREPISEISRVFPPERGQQILLHLRSGELTEEDLEGLQDLVICFGARVVVPGDEHIQSSEF